MLVTVGIRVGTVHQYQLPRLTRRRPGTWHTLLACASNPRGGMRGTHPLNIVPGGIATGKISSIFNLCYLVYDQDWLEKNKDQLSLTNPRDALHHGKRAANKGGCAQCDKLATELSWQRLRRWTFSSYSELSKVANFNLPHCIWRLRWGWPRLSFAEIFGVRQLESPSYRVALLAWSYV